MDGLNGSSSVIFCPIIANMASELNALKPGIYSSERN
jgi:hypothetical protein